MKRVFVLVSLVVAILVIVGNAFAQDETSNIPNPPLGPEWKLVFTRSGGTTYYVNTKRITYLPKGIVKVRVLWVPRGEFRREDVIILKNILLNPNNAERLWYETDLYKFNCKTNQYTLLKGIDYSFGRVVLDDESFQHELWDRIDPGTPEWAVEKYVCKEAPLSIPASHKTPPHKPSIPNPSLGPEWKLVGRGSNGSTLYFNTRKITYLPGGIVKVRELLVPRGEARRGLVNALKHDLTSEGKDPNNAERLWYVISLEKFNCKTHQFATLELINYSFGRAVLDDESAQYEKWRDIPPRSVAETIEKYVCNETPHSILAPHKPSIPNPSLGPEWKLVGRGSNGSTLYFNTRKITYLPGGIVKVRELLVPRGVWRRTLVNDLKMVYLSEGKDPNNAERFWYIKSLDEINCKTHQSATLETIVYSFGKTVLAHHSFQHEEWDRIPPGGAIEDVERYVCKEHKRKSEGY